MGGCCSSDEHTNEYYMQQQQHNQQFLQQQQGEINYGPLVRDEESIENLPNIVAFGKEVALVDEPVNPQENLIHDGQQFLMQSRVQDYDLLEPVEKSFRAVIASPERTNRVRYVNQVQDGAYVSEPLSDTQKDTRSMELNKNIRTIPLTNQVFPGSAINQSVERPFYNAATNQIARSTVSQNVVPVGSGLSSNIQNITNTLNNRNNNSNNLISPSSVIANQLTQDDGHQQIKYIQSQIVNNNNNNNSSGIQYQVAQQVQSQYNNGQQAITSQALNQAQQQYNNSGLQQQQAVLQQAAVSQLPSQVQQQIGQYVVQQQIQSNINNLSNPSGLLSGATAAPANNSAFLRSLNYN